VKEHEPFDNLDSWLVPPKNTSSGRLESVKLPGYIESLSVVEENTGFGQPEEHGLRRIKEIIEPKNTGFEKEESRRRTRASGN